MNKATDYVLMKICYNCNFKNPKNRKSCMSCGLLFLKEMDYDDYSAHIQVLLNEKARREGKEV